MFLITPSAKYNRYRNFLFNDKQTLESFVFDYKFDIKSMSNVEPSEKSVSYSFAVSDALWRLE